MESEHMVHGEDIDDDGGEGSVEVPLSGMENMINMPPPPRNDDRGGVSTLFYENLHPPRSIGFRVYKEVGERRRRGDVRG
jgi:hypothetical protein